MTITSLVRGAAVAAVAAAYVLSSIADTNTLLQTAIRVQSITYLAGALVFGIALYRARVLARWAAGLLAVGGVVTVALAVMPDAFARLLARTHATVVGSR